MTGTRAASSRALLVCVTSVLIASQASGQLKLRPFAGENKKITVQRGDTLYRIARRNDVSMSDLIRANGAAAEKPKAGDTLVIPLQRILPANPTDGVVLNIPERRLYLFKGGELVQTHAVAVGKADWQTDIGNFHIAGKAKNPTWYPPASMVKREGAKEDPVPPGPENPLGDRWIGWSAKGVGFHSTTSPRSIGGVVSHGCVRLYPDRASELYDVVTVGMPIYSVYETVLLAREGGSFYLSVWPNVYKRGGSSLADVEEKLRESGLMGGVDPGELRRIVGYARGLPQRIIGSDLKIEVNGKPVELPLAPTSVEERLLIPARAVVEAMGGTLTSETDGRIRITAGMKTLLVTVGKPEAEQDGVTATLPVPPAVAADTLIVPLRTILDLFGAELAREGDTLKITTPAAH